MPQYKTLVVIVTIVSIATLVTLGGVFGTRKKLSEVIKQNNLKYVPKLF